MNALLAFLAQFGLSLQAPPIHVLPHETLCRIMDNNCAHVAAVFLIDRPELNLVRGHIYLSDRVDTRTIKGQSIILHELVHAYQVQSGYYKAEECHDHLRAENLAYTLQNAFLAKHGHKPVRAFLPECPRITATKWTPYKP